MHIHCPHIPMTLVARTALMALATLFVIALMASMGVVSVSADETTTSDPSIQSSTGHTADTDTLHTWWHDKADRNAETAVADDTVRESPYYTTTVASTTAPDEQYDSFTYISIPRNGNDKIGYTDEDGAEFASEAGMSMSWSTFEYSQDVTVDVSLDTGQTITSADQVIIRPVSDNFTKTLVDSHTVRIHVPYNKSGYRFSVEFEPQMVTSYNDDSGVSGTLTTDSSSGKTVSEEPRNAMLIFAQPMLGSDDAAEHIPDPAAANVRRMKPGLVDDLDEDTTSDTLYFGPGTYWMGSSYRAQLPANITWVYLAPGAYVKGAFRFLSTTDNFKVTGYGVLSGEQYVYEADTNNDYNHRDASTSDCHDSCVKMLQFQSSGSPQTLDLQGVTVANPPYHSFVMYGDEDGPFAMTVNNYQQVGGWYWQTDGLELYRGSTLSNSFLHANDDVIKLYHSNVTVSNNVIWKNENGPVFQWGWSPRDIDDIQVSDTDIIHNRMYWKDRKYNTCVFNSSSSYLDMEAKNTASTAKTVQNMTFTNTNVEGMVNCAIRVFAMQNMKNVTIDGLHIDAWNGLDASSQQNLFTAFTSISGKRVSIGNQTADKQGLLLRNYTVGDVPITKSSGNWSSDQLGRLDFDKDLWDSWDAIADGVSGGNAAGSTGSFIDVAVWAAVVIGIAVVAVIIAVVLRRIRSRTTTAGCQ